MNGQNVSMKLGDNLQHIGKQSRLIVHLQNKRNRFSFCIVMKRKNIIFVFIEAIIVEISFDLCYLSNDKDMCNELHISLYSCFVNGPVVLSLFLSTIQKQVPMFLHFCTILLILSFSTEGSPIQ